MRVSRIARSPTLAATFIALSAQLHVTSVAAQPAEDEPAAEADESAPSARESAPDPKPASAPSEQPPAETDTADGVSASADVAGRADASASAEPPTPPSPPTQPAPPTPPQPPESPPRPYDGPPTLLGARPVHVGGYGGPAIAYTRVLDSHGVLVGGGAALLVDHRLAIGAAGYGLVNRVRGPDAPDGTESRLQLGYGGFTFHYHVLTNTLVYFSAGTLIGGGGVAFTEYDGTDWDDDDYDHDENSFFVIEPALGVHMNLTRWARVSLTAAYRVVNGIETRGLDDSDISGPSFGANMQFGWL